MFTCGPVLHYNEEEKKPQTATSLSSLHSDTMLVPLLGNRCYVLQHETWTIRYTQEEGQ